MRQQKGFGEIFLVVYSGALTLALGVIVLSGFRSEKKASFDELTVQRINVVEPDGTLRLVVSDKARFPGSYKKGKETPRPDRSSDGGFLFLDDEGSEIGGQVWSGLQHDGKTSYSGHLSFDRYDGDQQIVLDTGEENGKTASFLQINDSYTGMEKAHEAGRRLDALPPDLRKEALAQFRRDFPLTNRILLARDKDTSAMLLLADAQGRSRIALKVAPDGSPSIELLDEDGKVLSRLPQEER
jgi:hypothetical protein